MALSHEEIFHRNNLARMHLYESGVSPDAPGHAGGSPPHWRLETGHRIAVGLHPDTGEWGLNIQHYGDPTGTRLISMLGTHDEADVPGQVAREFRHRETMGHMRDQWQRAYLNNDPSGMNPGVRTYESGGPEFITLDHYGLHRRSL
jgi:hypothetical protein